MPTSLTITPDGAHPLAPRLGGGALIGGVADWPQGPFGHPLVLAASLPAAFLAVHAGIDIGAGRVASVFTTYLPGEYFLDHITYHGDAADLALLRRGTTQVLVHTAGALVQGALELPAHAIRAQAGGGDALSFIGGEPQWLQNEDLELGGLAFAWQIDGGDLPATLRNLFYLADGVGYLYLPQQPTGRVDCSGLFFVQVT
ncbi:hypothetical protein GmRootA79_53480 (plasmid) [Acidovorax sp. A79]|uniref:hypothetical protein n=1 Tax=Acidovorax sp. A79 TaxID=3056107 RepID=UPI0034E8478D